MGEGAMWKRIRGLGFAYGYGMSARTSEGLQHFNLYKATNVVAAYQEAGNIVKEYVAAEAGTEMKVPLDETALESTKSTVISDITNSEDTVSAAADQSLRWALRGQESGYNKRLLEAVSRVTLEQ